MKTKNEEQPDTDPRAVGPIEPDGGVPMTQRESRAWDHWTIIEEGAALCDQLVRSGAMEVTAWENLQEAFLAGFKAREAMGAPENERSE